MTKKNTELNVELSYGITQIKTKSISINEPDEFIMNSIDVIGQVEFAVNVGIDFTAEITFEIKSDFINSETKEILISHIGLTKYMFADIQSILDKDTRLLSLPDALIVSLYSMAHTHARALLAVELKNTIFRDKVFTPIVDPTTILQHKFKIDLN